MSQDPEYDLPVEPERTEDEIEAERIAELEIAIETGRPGEILEVLEQHHPADAADLLEVLPRNTLGETADLLGEKFPTPILIEMRDEYREIVVDNLPDEHLAETINSLESDDAALLFDDLEEDRQNRILDSLKSGEREELERVMSFDEETAGRLMQRDFVAVPQYWNVGQIIDYLRESQDLPDEFFEIFIVDPGHHPVGTIPLSRAMRSKRPVIVADLMEDKPKVIPVETDQEDVAYIFSRYDLASAPVVDVSGRIVGVIMVDDVVDVINEENQEDLMRLGGVRQDDLYTSVLRTTRTRFSWLAVNLITAIIASIVIAFFEATIEQLVALAVLMPIVASMGGNAGTQTLTVAVRALATRELTATNAARVVNKEVLVGLLNGVLCAILVGVVATAWFGQVSLGLVLAAAMVINLLVAGLCGILIPLGLHRTGVDPALAATVFVTTITDVVGFFAFLGLAAWLLL